MLAGSTYMLGTVKHTIFLKYILCFSFSLFYKRVHKKTCLNVFEDHDIDTEWKHVSGLN